MAGVMFMAINRLLGFICAGIILIAGLAWFMCWLTLVPFFLIWDLWLKEVVCQS